MAKKKQTTNSTNASTATSSGPQFIQDLLRQASGAAGDAFGGGGSSNLSGASDLVGRQISGEFLNPDTNPHLQNTFNRAADVTQTRLDSEFAGSGRNLAAARPARSDELQGLSASIFGNNFARERGIQQDSLTRAGDFDPIDQLIRRIGAISPAAGRTVSSTGTSGSSTTNRGSPLDSILGVASLF